MQQSRDSSGLDIDEWDIGIIGSPLDDRGYAATGFVQQKVKKVIHMTVLQQEFRFKLDNHTYDVDDADEAFQDMTGKSVLIESTTLGFVEILLISSALLKSNGNEVSYLYIEPKEYRRERKSLVLHRRDFDLSGEVPGYQAIPGYSLILLDNVNQKVIFFAGYESSRLEKALEDCPWILSKNASIVFGVPAFNPGWEIDSFTNNIAVISERNLTGGIHFAGATNPLAAYDLLISVHNGLEASEQLFIAPIGTKPLAIGIALFAIEKDNIGILYDHPIKKPGRTGDIANWHLFKAMVK